MDELKAGGFKVSQGALEALREAFDSGRCDEDETSATIRRVHAATGELLCPHSAVGVKVVRAQGRRRDDGGADEERRGGRRRRRRCD